MSSSNPGMRRDWSPSSPVSDRVWAQAVHAVVERRLSLRQAAQAFGLQQAALHRLVRQQTLQQLRHSAAPPRRSASPTKSDDSRFTAPAMAGTGSSPTARYVFPRLNPLALGHGSPSGGALPAVAPLASVVSPPAVGELTPELNDEVVSVLREQFMQQQQYDDYVTRDGHYDRLEGYADADITDVVRAIAGRNGRRALPTDFPSATWLAMFKRENDLVDVDDMVRARSRTSSGNDGEGAVPSQRQQQERYAHNYELEQQRYELEAHRWSQNRAYRQPAAPPPPPPPPLQCIPAQRRASYVWEHAGGVASGGDNLLPQQQQRLRYFKPPQRQPRDDSKFRRSPSAGSSNGRSGHSDSDRSYRQSNLVPTKVWEAAMEDVVIHGMSLRNAAKAHGVHFAALHRRLKKRQQHKLNMPCEPNYIPFEDEAGVVRVIHARAEMGVLLTFTELVDLLKRTALKHRSELPEDVATALVRKFQSRVEQSVRHLVIDWPAHSNNVLYRLRDTSSSEAGKDAMAAGVADANAGKSISPSVVSGSSGEIGSLSSSGSSSSLSPHPQPAAAFPVVRKSPVGAAPAPAWSNDKDSSIRGSVEAGSGSNNNSNDTPAVTVSPDNNNEAMQNQPCMILRL
ncbi:26S proteasome non-ATPase regulatory subunit 13 [Phytophthora pseudosyringae]|uniref:26S proteasome non-ATPase regulatory subunit 13 n=1 Tax=Phytophthora pseudosyringae TaxID=221518 RepID=A0A8T1VBP7_9STRA|nr:26S proteasome non-ATPase regulatory subunit 13 [Phytophthora pseudosyringae]